MNQVSNTNENYDREQPRWFWEHGRIVCNSSLFQCKGRASQMQLDLRQREYAECLQEIATTENELQRVKTDLPRLSEFLSN